MNSCPACGAPGPLTAVTEDLLKCEKCGAESVPAGATAVTLVHTQHTPRGIAQRVQLSPKFSDRFRPDRLLGAGAFGTVYLAEERKSGNMVAVKFLTRLEADALSRFLREGELMAQLDHPNVVRHLESGEIDHFPYLVSEYLEGGTLRRRLREGGRMAPAEAVAVFGDILAGLEACHARGIVHRDMKPDNVMFTADGRAKVGDLGIAKPHLGDYERLTRTGAMMGTPLYMSPEQGLGEKVGPASDIYSVGFMLHEALSGAVPFRAPMPVEMIRMHMERPPPPLQSIVAEVPDALAAVVLKALAKRPEARYPRAAAMAKELAESLRAAPAKPRRAPAKASAPSRARRDAVAATDQLQPRPPAGPDTIRETLATTLRRKVDRAPPAVRVGALSALGGTLVVGLAALATGWWAASPVVVEGPRPAMRLVHEGNAEYRARKLEHALALYDQALELEPTYARAHHNRAVVMADLGRRIDAESGYRTALRHDPAFGPSLRNLSKMLEASGQLEQAEALHRDLVAKLPHDARSHLMYGVFLEQRARPAEASESYRRALALKPDFAEAHCNLGGVLAARGHLPQAEQSLSRALELDPTLPLGYWWRGQVRLQRGEADAGEYDLARAVELDPRNAVTRETLARHLIALSKGAEALKHARELLRTAPDSPAAHDVLALALDLTGDKIAALQMAAKAEVLRARSAKK